MDVRAHFFDGSQQIEIILVGQARVNTADHVNFGYRHINVGQQFLAHHLHVHLVGGGTAFFGVKRAELAELVADVGVVDVLIADIVRFVAVQPFAHDVGKVAHCAQARRMVQPNAIFIRQAFLIGNLDVNVHQVRADIALHAPAQ